MNPNSIAELSATLLVAAALSTRWLPEAMRMHTAVRILTAFVVSVWLAFIAWCSLGTPPKYVLTCGFLAVAFATFGAIMINALGSKAVASGAFTTTTTAVKEGKRQKWTWSVVADYPDPIEKN